jgi:hypothetical protein
MYNEKYNELMCCSFQLNPPLDKAMNTRGIFAVLRQHSAASNNQGAVLLDALRGY